VRALAAIDHGGTAAKGGKKVGPRRRHRSVLTRGDEVMRTCVLAAVLVVASTGIGFAQDAGQAVFQRMCLPCHDAGEGARIKLGPPLNGIVGRKAGSFEGFNYSDPMKASGITWDEAQFKDYIKGPMVKVPGTRMAFAGLRDEGEQSSLWAYLSAFGADGKKK
jgi:cytochrome c